MHDTLNLRFLPGTSKIWGPPRGYVRYSRQWVGKTSLVSNYIHMVATEQSVIRKLPKYADAPIMKLFQYMRYGIIKEQFVLRLVDGRYWGRAAGYILTSDDTLLGDVSPSFYDYGTPYLPLWRHDALRHFKLPPITCIKGVVCVLNTLFCENFHHWLLDTIPKVGLLVNAGIELETIDYFIVNFIGHAYQKELLIKLGISENKLICPTQYTHIQAQELLVPSYSEPGGHPDLFNYTYEGIQFVRDLFLAKVSKPFPIKRRLLISRNCAAVRRWKEHSEALELLKPFGFECIALEQLTVQEQADCFQAASIIIMPHGGGLANCVFCKPGTVVVELFAPVYLPTFMLPLTNCLGLHYYAIVGETGALNDQAPTQSQHDISVDCVRLLEILKDVL